jgi:SAM-dependent methyltransferase
MVQSRLAASKKRPAPEETMFNRERQMRDPAHSATEPKRDDYWDSRKPTPRFQSIRQRLKRSERLNMLASWILSTRRGDEVFLLRTVRQLGLRTVLDVACGPGKAALATACETYGVDIPGAPLDVARALGYRATLTYEPPRFDFKLDREVDAITAIALNAHIPFDALVSILRSSLRYLKRGGYVVILAELDNRGVSYELIRRWDPSSFEGLVKAMGHAYFESEDSFLGKLGSALPELQIQARTAIVGSALPYLQYRHALTGSDPRTLGEETLACVFDGVVGLLNQLQLAFTDAKGKSFMVGITLRRTGSTDS